MTIRFKAFKKIRGKKMDLQYVSTRNETEKVTASEAILKGLASDGGLFVPTMIPKLDKSFEELKNISYQHLVSLFLILILYNLYHHLLILHMMRLILLYFLLLLNNPLSTIYCWMFIFFQ